MNPLIPPLTSTTLSPAQQQAKQLTDARQYTSQLMEATRAAVASFIWADPTQAQAAFNAFTAIGVKATDLLADEVAFQAFIQARTGALPPSLMPAGYSLTPNADGTVTVVAPAPTTGS